MAVLDHFDSTNSRVPLLLCCGHVSQGDTAVLTLLTQQIAMSPATHDTAPTLHLVSESLLAGANAATLLWHARQRAALVCSFLHKRLQLDDSE